MGKYIDIKQAQRAVICRASALIKNRHYIISKTRGFDEASVLAGYRLSADDAHETLSNAPAADVVEVVRCEDCKHWKSCDSMAGNSFYDIEPIGGCKWVNFCRKASDFCSYGERRDEEGT